MIAWFRSLRSRIPHWRRVFLVAAAAGVVSALNFLPEHWREWLPTAVPAAVGMFLLGAVMTLICEWDELKGLRRAKRRIWFVLRDVVGLGFVFGAGFAAVAGCLKLAGLPVSMIHTFATASAVVRLWVLTMAAGLALGSVVGVYLRKEAKSLLGG